MKANALKSLFNDFAGQDFVKKRLQRGCFPVHFAKLLKNPFLIEHLLWFLLNFASMLEYIEKKKTTST